MRFVSVVVVAALLANATFLLYMHSTRITPPAPPPPPPARSTPVCPAPQSASGGDAPWRQCARAGGCPSVHPSLVPADLTSWTATTSVALGATVEVPVTFVTAPRAFDGETDERQRAAVLSWHMLPGVHETLLMGDDAGVAETAREWGFKHVGSVGTDPAGVPMMDSLLQLATEQATHGILCYVNADITLPPTWWRAVQAVLPWLLAQGRPFLLVGPRLEFNQGVVWHPTMQSWAHFKRDAVDGKKYSLPVIDGAIDWFVFRRGDFLPFPPFKLGRYVWDSWMVHHAVTRDWVTVATFNNVDVEDHAAYALHWWHSREHQKSAARPDNPRAENDAVANSHGGWINGRLRSAKLMLVPCSLGPYCVRRMPNRKNCYDQDIRE